MLEVFQNESFVSGLLHALYAGLFTGIGGFAVYLKKKYTQNNINIFLSISAGIMLSVAFFALLVPSMNEILDFYHDVHVAGFWYCGSVLTGVALVWILNVLLPHEHNHMLRSTFDLRKAWLFIIAISLHKLPEGLAVGIAYGAQDVINPLGLAIGVALHNIPEGLTIAIALIAAGETKLKSAFTSLCIGMVQPLGALIGLLFIGVSETLIPLAMAISGGTLLCVVISEILPETYNSKNMTASVVSVFAGFIVMCYILMTLGE